MKTESLLTKHQRLQAMFLFFIHNSAELFDYELASVFLWIWTMPAPLLNYLLENLFFCLSFSDNFEIIKETLDVI